MKYTTKAYDVDAVKFTGNNILEVMQVIGQHLVISYTNFTHVTSEAYPTLAVNIQGFSVDVPIDSWLLVSYDVAGVQMMTDADFNEKYTLIPTQK